MPILHHQDQFFFVRFVPRTRHSSFVAPSRHPDSHHDGGNVAIDFPFAPICRWQRGFCIAGQHLCCIVHSLFFNFFKWVQSCSCLKIKEAVKPGSKEDTRLVLAASVNPLSSIPPRSFSSCKGSTKRTPTPLVFASVQIPQKRDETNDEPCLQVERCFFSCECLKVGSVSRRKGNTQLSVKQENKYA